MATNARHRAGAAGSVGGRFAPTSRSESDVAITDGTPCSSCGTSTKRSSGLCRRCDPKRTKPSGPVAGVEHVTRSGPILDRTVTVDIGDIVQCDYGFVPVYRGGARVEGQVRGCRNAVRSPATTCHQHGGSTETSLGRTISKALAEAGRGECHPLAAEHWAQTDERLAAAQGRLLGLLETDTTAIAQLYVEWRRQDADGVARFSPSNQMLVLAQHWANALDETEDADEADSDAAMALALKRLKEPHLNVNAWAKKGRAPIDGEPGVAVVWWKPGSKPKQKADETDEEYELRCARSRRGFHGAHLEFPLSSTDGDEYPLVEEPLAAARPTGFGDPDAAISQMERLAADMGIKVVYTDHQDRGAIAYWLASESKINVWTGVGGGDARARAHSLAHELGHALLGHSTDAQAEERSAEKEVAAESFAALALAHHGIDSSEISAHYIEGWRRGAGIDMKSAGLGPLRSAVVAFDGYVTATANENTGEQP